MIGGLPQNRYFISCFLANGDYFEISLPQHTTFEDVQRLIGPDICRDVQELTGRVFRLKKEDLFTLGINIDQLPDGIYSLDNESDGFYSSN